MANYNIIAPVYDRLADWFIPMRAWKLVHDELIHHLPSEGVVWILGTGSGAFLKTYQGNCSFVSIDPSVNMTQMARKNLRQLKVQFVQSRHDRLPWSDLPTPDIIICPFFLQLLQPEEFGQFHKQLSTRYPAHTLRWLYADFENPPFSGHWLWQWPYVVIMFLFLWLTTGKAVFRLHHWQASFQEYGYHCHKTKPFARGLVWFRSFEKDSAEAYGLRAQGSGRRAQGR